eukprot:3047444-Amphidinium_carterae.2
MTVATLVLKSPIKPCGCRKVGTASASAFVFAVFANIDAAHEALSKKCAETLRDEMDTTLRRDGRLRGRVEAGNWSWHPCLDASSKRVISLGEQTVEKKADVAMLAAALLPLRNTAPRFQSTACKLESSTFQGSVLTLATLSAPPQPELPGSQRLGWLAFRLETPSKGAVSFSAPTSK